MIAAAAYLALYFDNAKAEDTEHAGEAAQQTSAKKKKSPGVKASKKNTSVLEKQIVLTTS